MKSREIGTVSDVDMSLEHENKQLIDPESLMKYISEIIERALEEMVLPDVKKASELYRETIEHFTKYLERFENELKLHRESIDKLIIEVNKLTSEVRRLSENIVDQQEIIQELQKTTYELQRALNDFQVIVNEKLAKLEYRTFNIALKIGAFHYANGKLVI